MLFLISISISLITGILIVSLFKLKRISETILALSLILFANIVIVFQFANLIRQMNSPIVILIIQGIVLLSSISLWAITKRPALFPTLNYRIKLRDLLKDRKNRPIFILLSTLFGVFILYLVLIYIVPPNNNDALFYHISRIVKWKQIGTYFPWDTPFVWQVSFPVNAQLTYFWTLLFTNTDHFIAYIPFLAGIVTSLLVYLLAREFGFHQRPSTFAALIWLTFPVVQLHLTSVRHDLISTWLFISSFYFLYRWGIDRRAKYMILSAMALGLVIGTNFSIVAYLPGLIVILIIWLFTRRYTWKQFFMWGSSAFIAFLIFSSPIFFSNWIHFHSPVGPDAKSMTSMALAEEMPIGKYLAINTARWSYQLLDFSSLPKPLSTFAVDGKAWMIQQLLTSLHIKLEGNIATMNAHEFYWNTEYQLQEDEAWYGLVGAALVFPTSLIVFIQAIKKRRMLNITPFIFLISAMITGSLVRPGWTPYDGRYFMPLVALCTALLPLWLLNIKSSQYLQYGISLFSIIGIMMVVIYNPAKQVIGGSSIWDMNRIDRMTRQSYTSKEMLYLVEAAIPEVATVGVATDNIDYQEYGIYGEKFTRTIINIYPPENIGDAVWLEQRGVNYLLILVSEGYPGKIADGFNYVDSLGNWVVYSNIREK